MNVPAKKPTPQATQKEQVREIELTLKTMRSRLVEALPPTIPVQQFVSTILTACADEPKLLTCDRHSLFLSCLKSARDGLMPDGREAAIVPFKDHKANIELATYMPMVAGLLKKIRNSGQLAGFSANAIYANDFFEYELGDNERIVHKPVWREERGHLVGAYAIGKTKDGVTYRRVLGMEDIDAIKSASKAVEKGPWSGRFESEMWIKSAIRRLSKLLPQSTDINAYLSAGPPLPTADVDSVLPAATGAEGFHSLEYEIRTRALLALRDESDSLALLNKNWIGIRAEYDKIGAEIPLELEDVFNMRSEKMKEAVANDS